MLFLIPQGHRRHYTAIVGSHGLLPLEGWRGRRTHCQCAGRQKEGMSLAVKQAYAGDLAALVDAQCLYQVPVVLRRGWYQRIQIHQSRAVIDKGVRQSGRRGRGVSAWPTMVPHR